MEYKVESGEGGKFDDEYCFAESSEEGEHGVCAVQLGTGEAGLCGSSYRCAPVAEKFDKFVSL